VPNKNCIICNKPFWTRSIKKYCSITCHDIARRTRENKRYKDNPQIKELALKRYYKNKEKVLIKKKEWYLKNRDEVLKQRKELYESDIEKHRKLSRENNKKLNIIKARKKWLENKLLEDPDYINRASRKSHQQSKDKRNEYSRKYYKKNLEKIAQQKKEWGKKNNKREDVKARRRSYTNNYRKIPTNKIGHQYRARINAALNSKGLRKRKGKLAFLGCSLEDFKKYLESKFKSGMNWSNYKWDGWHVDHIKPIASFDLTNEEDFKKCFHYTNLQPLWADENFKKSDKN
jgi:hypothetical protein